MKWLWLTRAITAATIHGMQHVQILFHKTGRTLMLARAIHHIGLRMSTRIHSATIRIQRENMRGASLATYRQPSTITREANIPHLGVCVTSIQRVQVFDHGPRWFKRIHVYLKHVKVLPKRVSGHQKTAATVEFKRVDGLLMCQKMSHDPLLVFVVDTLRLAARVCVL